MTRPWLILPILVAAAAFAVEREPQTPSGGATNLTLAPGLSFTNDDSSNFPIRGDGLASGRIASDRPTIVFLGTSHCWNTNREAERLVAFWARHRDEARFLVVDLDHVGPEQKPLVTRLFSGSIPTLAFFDARGRIVYDRAGETSARRGDVSRLESLLEKAKDRGSP